MRRFLAYNRRFRQEPGQSLGKDRLALMIGHGNDVIRRLVLDLVRGERLVVRQDCSLGGIAHDGVNRTGKGVHQLAPVTNDNPR